MTYADGIIIHSICSEASTWAKKLDSNRSIPIFWWCEDSEIPDSTGHLDKAIDGMLCTGMNDRELHWSFHLGTQHYLQRTQWEKEREQLLSRLEERKWIEKAKSIISRNKNLTEIEAYEFLRKQAMNERKRLVDVCTSIVKVYQLLHEES